jgi:hypothetical protein
MAIGRVATAQRCPETILGTDTHNDGFLSLTHDVSFGAGKVAFISLVMNCSVQYKTRQKEKQDN